MFARLAIPHLYETPFLYTYTAQHRFSLILAGNRGPTLGPYVREITFNTFHDLDLLVMLQHTSRIKSLIGHGSESILPATALELLAKSVGNSLQTLRNVAFDKPWPGKGAIDPTPLASFTQLVFLEWECNAPLKSLRNRFSSTALGNLTTLAIREYHATFLALLSDLQLPALQNVEFPAAAGPRGASAFFRKHGKKLVRATLGASQLIDAELGVLSLCPALTELCIAYNQNHPVGSLHLNPTTAHANLRKIVFAHPAENAYRYYRMSRPHRTLFGQFIQGICNASTREDPVDPDSLVLLPALEEIQHPHCRWPRTEKEIARDEWVEWAEKLSDAAASLHRGRSCHCSRRVNAAGASPPWNTIMDRVHVHLPDEILSEILTPALRVSEDAFSSTDASGMSFSESSSAYLLVCKDWLRVSTPLLYGVVVLRSKAQAQALATALQSNPDLGRFIKKLRLESGYGRFMQHILQATPNIAELFLTFSLLSTDSVSGLTKGLPLINPRRLFLHKASQETSAPGRTLVTHLAKCIPTWSNLTTVEASTERWGYSSSNALTMELAVALGLSESLTSFILRGRNNVPRSIPNYMIAISNSPSLKAIQFQPPLQPVQPSAFMFSLFGPEFYDQVRAHERLRDLIALPGQLDVSPSASSNLAADSESTFVYPSRLSTDSDLEDQIWGRVLSFVFSVPSTQYRETVSFRHIAPLLVCKMFYRLSLPYLYASPILLTHNSQQNFSETLSGPRGLFLGSCVRTLKLLSLESEESLAILRQTQNVQTLLCHAALPVPVPALTQVAQAVGGSLRVLRGLVLAKSNGRIEPPPLGLFAQLVSLEWNCKAQFKSSHKHVPASALGNLTTLSIQEYDPTFLTLLSDLDLPSLQRVDFPPSASTRGAPEFFAKHGDRLTQATLGPVQLADAQLRVLSLCPALTQLRVVYNKKYPVRPFHLDPHANLRSIVIDNPPGRSFRLRSGRLSKSHRAMFGEFIEGIGDATRDSTNNSLPALTEIRHVNCRWPNTEQAIAKDEWVGWAEQLLDVGSPVTLLGMESDTRWRRRLQLASAQGGVQKSARKSK
uniref:F-box domain-containing protein n=1 Tax=Mycena chlorophos TaxID=658473 RepID=A0ABQ0LGP5_MYCCL|nr:predicted protein [Mycena chlorophos]